MKALMRRITLAAMATLAGSFFSWDLYIRWAVLFLVSTLAGGLVGGWVYSEAADEPAAEEA